MSGLAAVAPVGLWPTVIGGTYIVLPPYRATPPEGMVDLTAYPRSLLLADPDTAWLHSFAMEIMEIKEHLPWIAAMLATAAAFIARRHAGSLFRESLPRRLTLALSGLSLALVAGASTLGVFVNKVAPDARRLPSWSGSRRGVCCTRAGRTATWRPGRIWSLTLALLVLALLATFPPVRGLF